MKEVSQRDFYQIMTDSVSWAFESKSNFLSCAIPIITYVATHKFSQLSYIYSLWLAGGNLATFKLFQYYCNSFEAKQTKSKENDLHQNIQLFLSYLPFNLEEMQKIFNGYEFNEKGEETNKEQYSKKQKDFLNLCGFFHLNHLAVENVWKSFPEKGKDDTESRYQMLLSLMPAEMKSKFGKSE